MRMLHRFPHLSDESGVTMIEVLIASVVLLFLFTAVTRFSMETIMATKQSYSMSTAGEVAAATIEDWKRTLCTMNGYDSHTDSIDANGGTYVVAHDTATVKNTAFARSAQLKKSSGGIRVAVQTAWRDDFSKEHMVSLAVVVPDPKEAF